jgi:hypothetical protein
MLGVSAIVLQFILWMVIDGTLLYFM